MALLQYISEASYLTCRSEGTILREMDRLDRKGINPYEYFTHGMMYSMHNPDTFVTSGKAKTLYPVCSGTVELEMFDVPQRLTYEQIMSKSMEGLTERNYVARTPGNRTITLKRDKRDHVTVTNAYGQPVEDFKDRLYRSKPKLPTYTLGQVGMPDVTVQGGRFRVTCIHNDLLEGNIHALRKPPGERIRDYTTIVVGILSPTDMYPFLLTPTLLDSGSAYVYPVLRYGMIGHSPIHIRNNHPPIIIAGHDIEVMSKTETLIKAMEGLKLGIVGVDFTVELDGNISVEHSTFHPDLSFVQLAIRRGLYV